MMVMKKIYYNIYGINICSELGISDEIGNTHLKVGNSPDVIIRFGKVNFPQDKLIKKNFIVTEDSIYIFEKNIGKVKIYDGKEIIIEPSKNVNNTIFLPHNLGMPLALLLHQRGLLVLHGSAIVSNKSIIGILGQSGEGKSTTTYGLYKSGFDFFSDEFIVIDLTNPEEPIASPGFPMLKLSKDLINHFENDSNTILTPIPDSDKYIYKIDLRYNKNSLPLKQIYILKNGKKTNISELSLQDALMSLIENNYCIAFKDSYDAKIFPMCVNLLKNIKINNLEIVHSYDKLPEISKIIETNYNK